MSSMEDLSLYQVGQSKDRSGRALVFSVVCICFVCCVRANIADPEPDP